MFLQTYGLNILQSKTSKYIRVDQDNKNTRKLTHWKNVLGMPSFTNVFSKY